MYFNFQIANCAIRFVEVCLSLWSFLTNVNVDLTTYLQLVSTRIQNAI